MLDGNLQKRHLSENDSRVVEGRKRTSKFSPLIEFSKQEFKRELAELRKRKIEIVEELKQISFYEIELNDIEREIEILQEEEKKNNRVGLIRWHLANKKKYTEIWNKGVDLNRRRNDLMNLIFNKFELENELNKINREIKARETALESSKSLKASLEYDFAEVSNYLLIQIKRYLLNINTVFVEAGFQKEEIRVIQMLYEYFNSQNVVKILRNKFGLSFKVDSIDKIKMTVDLLFSNDLSLQDKKIILNEYVDFLENKKNEVENYAEKCKLEFKEKVIQVVNEGKLPRGFLFLNYIKFLIFIL